MAGLPILALLFLAVILVLREVAPNTFRRRKWSIIVYLVLVAAGLFMLARVMS